MVDVSNSPLGSSTWTGNLRMADPVAYVADPRFVTMLYPWPQDEGRTTYASWKLGALGWSASETIGAEELFQLSDNRAITDTPGKGRVTIVHGERGGPLDWLMITGLF